MSGIIKKAEIKFHLQVIDIQEVRAVKQAVSLKMSTLQG